MKLFFYNAANAIILTSVIGIDPQTNIVDYEENNESFFTMRTTTNGIIIDGAIRFIEVIEGYGHVSSTELGDIILNQASSVDQDVSPPNYALIAPSLLERDASQNMDSRGAIKLNLIPGQTYTINIKEQPESYDTSVTEYVGYNPNSVTTMTFTFNPGDLNNDGTKDSNDIIAFIQGMQESHVTIIEPGYTNPEDAIAGTSYNGDAVADMQDVIAFLGDFQSPILP